MTFNPAPDVTSGSETATLDTETPLEQHLEQESSGQQCSSLAVLNLIRKDTFTHKRGTRIPGKISERSNTVDLPETLHGKKEYSRSKNKEKMKFQIKRTKEPTRTQRFSEHEIFGRKAILAICVTSTIADGCGETDTPKTLRANFAVQFS